MLCVCRFVGVYIHVGWNPCPGHPTKVSSKGPTPSSIKLQAFPNIYEGRRI